MEKDFRFVGFWKRVWMSFIDGIILILYAIVILLINKYIIKIDIGSDLQYLYHFIFLFIIPIIIAYFLLRYKSATFGKMICKTIIVHTETGLNLSNKQVIHRMLGYLLSNNSFFFSFIHAAFDSRKQTWHDRLAKTVVINSKDKEYYRQKEKTKPIKRDKKLLKIESYLFFLFLIIFLVFNFFQYYDEPVKPEAKKWLLESIPKEEIPEENGFYFLVGFDCLETDDPSQIGYNWVQNQNDQASNEYEEVNIVFTDNWTDEEKAALDKKNKERDENNDFKRIDLEIIRRNFAIGDSIDSLEFFVKNENLIDSLKIAYAFLNNRYKKISTLENFNNTLIPHYKVRSPFSFGIVAMKRLNLAWIGKEYKKGNKQEAIEKLQQEIELSRYLLRQTQSLTGKLLANILIELDLQLFSTILDGAYNDDIKALLPNNLTPVEKNWEKVAISIFYESVSSYQIFHDPSYIKAESNGKISAFFLKFGMKKIFKIHKLINETYDRNNFLFQLSMLNAKEFVKQKQKYRDYEVTYWDKIFNPVGSVFISGTVPIYFNYIAQFHDIDGYINMLKFKLMIKENSIEPHEIQLFLNSHSDSLFNPYTEEPIKWDSEKSILFFESDSSDDFIGDESILREMGIKL